MSPLPIDLESETISYDGHWYTRDELARRIRAMLDAGDFAVSRPSQALEQLTLTLSALRTMAFKVPPEMADALNQAAARSGRSVGALIRESLAEYLGLTAPQAPPPASMEASPRPAGPAGRKPTEPELPIVVVAPISASAAGMAPDLKTTQQISLPPQLIPGPGALRGAQAGHPPSVVVDRGMTADPNGAEEITGSGSASPKKPEDEAVERRWFGS